MVKCYYLGFVGYLLENDKCDNFRKYLELFKRFGSKVIKVWYVLRICIFVIVLSNEVVGMNLLI